MSLATHQEKVELTNETYTRLINTLESTENELKNHNQRSGLTLEQIEKMNTRLNELTEERNTLAQEIATLKREGVGVGEKGEEETVYRRAVRKYLAKRELEADEREALKADRQTRALNPLTSTVASDGGIFAPEDVKDEIIRYVNNTTNMLQLCRVYRTNRGSMKVNSLRRRDTVSWRGTETAVDGTQELSRFGQIEFVPTRPKEMVYIDEDMLDDTDQNVEAYVQEEQGVYFGDVLEFATMQGTGNQEPTGVTKAGLPTLQATTGATNVFEFDDIVKAIYSLRQGYRRGARFVMHRYGVEQARLLKDNDDKPLWQPSQIAGEPDRLAGYPVLESEYFPQHIKAEPGQPALDAGQPLYVFGDFRYYGICLRRDFTVKVYDNDHSLGLEGQIGYRFDMRADGKPLFDEAFTVFTRSQ